MRHFTVNRFKCNNEAIFKILRKNDIIYSFRKYAITSGIINTTVIRGYGNRYLYL